MNQWHNKEWLKQQYWNKELSLQEIAKQCCLKSSVTIFKWMRKFNIPRRTVSEANTGERHWGYGKKRPLETIRKMSAPRASVTKENNPNWKGGKRTHYGNQARKKWKEFYKTEIPSGIDIHHRDENIRNNNINNLVALLHGKHISLHKIGKPRPDTVKRDGLGRFKRRHNGMEATKGI